MEKIILNNFFRLEVAQHSEAWLQRSKSQHQRQDKLLASSYLLILFLPFFKRIFWLEFYITENILLKMAFVTYCLIICNKRRHFLLNKTHKLMKGAPMNDIMDYLWSLHHFHAYKANKLSSQNPWPHSPMFVTSFTDNPLY